MKMIYKLIGQNKMFTSITPYKYLEVYFSETKDEVKSSQSNYGSQNKVISANNVSNI